MAKSLEIEKIIYNWDDFIKRVTERPDYRTLTRDSWNRCETYDPEFVKLPALTEGQLEHLIAANNILVEAISPFMENMNFYLRDIPHVAVLTDNNGMVLNCCGNKTREYAVLNELREGVDLSEQYCGNNGIGTSLIKGEPVLVYGFEHYSKRYKPLSSFGVPLKNTKKELVGLLGVFLPAYYLYPEQLILALDCAEVIEDKFNNSSRNVKEGEKLTSNDRLIAATVHDLRQPLTAVKDMLQFKGHEASNKTEKDNVNKVSKQLNLQSKLLNTILLIHKPEKACTASVSELLELLISRLKPLCAARNVEVTYEKDETARAKIKVNLFMKAMENLFLKAAYSIDKKQGHINIKVEKPGDKVLISISDNGPGIPAHIQPELFRLPGEQAEEENGLSLYMVNRIVKDVHQGRIWFNTGEGRGTTYYIEIPSQ